MRIREVKSQDAEQLAALYAPYVHETTITMEHTAPTVSEFASRIQTICKDFPYLVAEEEAGMVGYAYASTYRARAGFDWTVEVSIYLSQEARGRGIGSLLYQQLEEALQARGIKHCLACITLPNEASMAFHRKRGYQQVAHFKDIAYKFGSWHDIVWLQKSLVEEG